MGPKKKPAKKAGDEDGDDPAAMNAALEAAVDSLKMKLVFEQERKDKSMTYEKQVQDNEKELRAELNRQ